jgi:S1/P1 nuclease/metal binding Ada-like protein
MHLKRPSCLGIPSKDHPIGRGVLVGILLVLVAVSSALAWNKAGHMVSGAIAYADLKQANPQTLARVIVLLKTHPHFETKWAPQLTQLNLSSEEQDLYLFMLAARWPDDIRGDPAFHHGPWHYINIPYKPEGQPASVQTVDPPPENILRAYQTNFDILRSTAPESTKAVALCWIFHLIGDVHQPLHTVALFTTQFPPPEGDRGGTRFSIRARDGAHTISLHAFWDDLILGSERFQSVRNTATALRLQPDHARAQLPELRETSFEQWAKQESFSLAKDQVYRNGQLRGSRDQHNGEVFPTDYIETVKPLAERRIVLAGYRLADVLTQIASHGTDVAPAGTPQAADQGGNVRGNKHSKIYHLPGCPGFKAMSPANIVMFTSEAEARQAGYRKAKNCP